jgi:LmbE family N-acetylglucosaminyl deacetylase
MRSALKLLCVLAHPDDESIALGGTLAKYASEGVETSLVMATRGERGWFKDPGEYPGEKMLGSIREHELRKACQILGISQLEFLDYVDGDVDQANETTIIARIVRAIRMIRPDVVVTFGPDGLYGHPDHIAISQFTTSALLCAADQSYPHVNDLAPHCVAKLYYRISPSEWFNHYMPIFGDIVMWIDGQERRAMTWGPWAITTRLDTSAYCQQIWQAIQCHQTQIPTDNSLPALSEEMHQRLWGTQEFYRAFSLVNGGRKEEHDLFEGLRISTPVANTEMSSIILSR